MNMHECNPHLKPKIKVMPRGSSKLLGSSHR